jgi:hypothetical protein
MSEGVARPSGSATFEILRRRSWVPEELDARLRAWNPRTHLGDIVQACFRFLPTGLALELLDAMKVVLIGESSLVIDVVRANGDRESWGEVSRKVITNTGVNAAIAAMGGSLGAWGTFNYHGLGTGSNAESPADTALQTEITNFLIAQRSFGPATNPAPNQFRTSATNAVVSPVTVQEHGVFSATAFGTGSLLDRSLTGGQSLQANDGMLATYTFELVSGG